MKAVTERERAGFTLLELLVVIGIIAILASMLGVALAKAKANARAAGCLNNLRQMQLAWQAYADDNADYVPPNPTSTVDQWGQPAPAWVADNMAYETEPGMATWFPESTNTALLIAPGPGHLGPYVPAPGVFKCPSDRSWILLGGSRWPRVRSYTMNQAIGFYDPVEVVEGWSTVMGRTSDVTVPGPADLCVFVDTAEDSVFNGLFPFSPLPAFLWAGRHEWMALPGARHDRRGILSFVDGHVEFRRWTDPALLGPSLRRPGLNVPTTDLRDLTWFSHHATSLNGALFP